MRIQHNIAAMNAYRNYGNNTKALNANLEKLSSGYKINRAGDDAAGLAVSEKMRAQITGLNAATKNTKDAVSMVKTAEGALQEVQDMMNRMVYLSEEAANGIYDTGIDRAALQDEVVSLTQEIHRIAENANFNGKKLFTGGGIATAIFQIGPDTGEQLSMSEALNNDYSSFNLSELIDNICEKGESAPKDTYAFVSEDGVEHALNMVRLLRGDQAAIAEATDSSKITYGAATTGASSNGEGGLGLINVVSSFRGKLGAVQNRLEHTLNNLSVMTENIQDAESTVRDTDVAEEMMAYTKNNILIQSAQAMLAQANAVPQGVLQLLQ